MQFLSFLPAVTWSANRQWSAVFCLRKLLAFIFLLTGLGASRAVLAQTFSNNAIVLTQQPSGGSSSTIPYAGKRQDAPYNTYTRLGNNSANPAVATPALGTYDLNNTSQLQLTGGSLEVSNPNCGTAYVNAQLNYRVYLTGTQAPAYSVLNFAPAAQTHLGNRFSAATTRT